MHGYSTDKVVNDWDEVEGCPFSEKRWVNPENMNIPKEKYEKGDCPRGWCLHDECWCQAELGYEYCRIYTDHRDE